MKLYTEAVAAWAHRDAAWKDRLTAGGDIALKDTDAKARAADAQLAAALQPVLDQYSDGLLGPTELLQKLVIAADGQPTL